jgi:hypothetical protein
VFFPLDALFPYLQEGSPEVLSGVPASQPRNSHPHPLILRAIHESEDGALQQVQVSR